MSSIMICNSCIMILVQFIYKWLKILVILMNNLINQIQVLAQQ